MSEYLRCRFCGWEHTHQSRDDAWQVVKALRKLGVKLPGYAVMCPDCFTGWLATRLDNVPAPARDQQ